MKKPILLTLSALALLTACSGIQQRAGERETVQRYMAYAGAPISGFSILGRISGWHPLARDKLVVWTGVNDAYLLTVDSFCLELEFAESISVTTTGGASVQSGFDYVRFWNSFRRERCRIVEIRPVDYRRLRQETGSHTK